MACGGTIGSGETVTLTADVGPCDGVESAIIIDSAILDLGGYTVICADTNQDGEVSYGLDIRGRGAQVRNGTVIGCFDNVYVAGSKQTVENITSQAATNYGFYVASTSSKNRIANNTSTGSADDGFQVRGKKQTVESNVATNNGDDGLDGDGGETSRLFSKSKFTSNTATANVDNGIEVTGTRNRISGNTATGNGGIGIGVGDRKNKVFGNTATGNGGTDIFGVEPCKANKFKDNTFGTGSDCVK